MSVKPDHNGKAAVVAVVEDDAALLRAIPFALEAEGYAVRAFDSGADLLAAEGLEEVACFVVDYNLPDLEGLRVIEELQQRELKARFVVITTNPPADLREACWVLGVPIVEKPLLGESLNACIRGLLAKPLSGARP